MRRKFSVKHLKQTEQRNYFLGESIREEEKNQAISCWRKVYYGSQEKALKVVNNLNLKQKAYYCRFCKGWHLAKK